MKLLPLTTLSLLIALSTIACDKAESKKIENIVESEKIEEIELTGASFVAKMMIDSASLSLKAVGDAVEEEQKECIQKIDIDSQMDIAEDIINKEFNAEELKELTDFYSQPEVVAVTDYGLEQVLITTGVKTESTIDKPSPEAMKMVVDFSITTLGKKFISYNLAEGEGTLNTTFTNFVTAELAKCGLNDNKQSF